MTRLMLVLLLCAGCQKASDVASEKQMPKLPPPPKEKAQPSPALHIPVEIDGQPAAPLDAARLAKTKADFEDVERRAWKLPTLLGPAAARPGAAVAVTGEKGVTVVLHQPRSEKEALPVIAVSRRGGIVAAMVQPDDPFPPYHGQGRRLQRPGDPLPRIDGIRHIKVYLERIGLDTSPSGQ